MEETVDVTQPDDGGSLPVPGVVRLTARSVSGYIANLDHLEPYIRLNNDGHLSIPTDDPSDEWLTPQPVTTLIASLYEVRADFIDAASFDPSTNTLTTLDASAITGPSLGDWHSISSDRQWSFYPGLPGKARIRLRIRDAATHTQQARVTITFLVQDTRTPPGDA